GVASGAGPMAGLYGAIFVGFFASLFGGTPPQISGPTGPMTVVMAAVFTQYAHDPAMAFTVVMLGGAFQILFGALRLGSYISLVPFTVISGFMSGIGVIIIILQLAPFLGHVQPGGGTLAALAALPAILADIRWDALGVGALALAVVVLTPVRLGRFLPSPLVALIAGTAVTAAFLPGVPVLGDIPTGLPDVVLPAFSLKSLPGMIGSGLILALLGSIDSLLTSLITDSITRRHHQSDRELIGQGIGNIFAGLFGAIPGAGATMRTVVNVRAGGSSPVSGMLHALVLLSIVLGLGPVAESIPHAVLAGILIKVGVDIIDWRYLKLVHLAPRPGVILMFLVLGLTVFVDLIVAVAVGIVAASLLLVKRTSDQQLESIRAAGENVGDLPLTAEQAALLDRHKDDIMYYHLGGPISFSAAKGMTRRLVIGDHHGVLMLDLTDVTFIDTSAAMALESAMLAAKAQGLDVLLVGLRAGVERVMSRLGILAVIDPENRCAERADAFARAVRLMESRTQ
ncbi:MAG: SulP family inorganic anion transporter, partial [Rhodospirillales bacterium]|nr:SulP family inorganic anion transporter [Rhodospirillales bacterium]